MNPVDLVIVAVCCGVLARALARHAPTTVPTAGLLAQGVLGVYTGLMARSISFAAVGSNWPIVITVAVATLAICVAGGALLGLYRDVSSLTGSARARGGRLLRNCRHRSRTWW